MIVQISFRLLLMIMLISPSKDTVRSEYLDCENENSVLTGAGSSFPAELHREIGSKYAANRTLAGLRVHFQYYRKNSGYGKERIAEAIPSLPPVMFAASESLLSADTRLKHPNLKTFPVLAGALVIVYNIPEVEQQQMESEGNNFTHILAISDQSLVGIYNGTIRYWNDPALKLENPKIRLPNEKIRVVARSDNAGDTDIFTHALSLFDKNWALRFGGHFSNPGFPNGKCCNSTNWPPNVIEFFAKQVTGMVGIIGSIPYTIGYAAEANVRGYDIHFADLINRAGKRISPSIASVQAAMDYHLTRSSGSVIFPLNNALSSQAYPIASFSYLIVNSTTHPRVPCCQAAELAGFINFILDSTPSSTFQHYSLVPLSRMMAAQVRNNVLKTVTCNGENSYQMYLQTLEKPTEIHAWQIVVPVLLAIIFLSFIFGSVYIFRIRKAQLADETKWLIPPGIIRIHDADDKPGHTNRSGDPSLDSFGSSVANSNNRTVSEFSRNSRQQSYGLGLKSLKHIFFRGNFDQMPVLLAPLRLGYPTLWQQETKLLCGKLRENIIHNNVCHLLGITSRNGRVFSVFEFAEKGTLHFVLQTCRYELSDSIKFNMAQDVAQGMKFLHRKGLMHGLLSSITCYVDSSWTLKVACWERFPVYFEENPKEFNLLIRYKDELSEQSLIKLLYLDPEIFCALRQPFDVYSFGMLLVEIFTGKLPFFQEIEEGSRTYTQILRDKFFNYNILPKMAGLDMSVSVRDLVNCCVGEVKYRPSFSEIADHLQKTKPTRKGIVDMMMDTMENYMETLETKVEERTVELQQVTNRMQDLLHEVLPPQIAAKLFNGETVQPEYFENVTVYFSDIVGFTSISSKSSPLEVMTFLNDLWVTFDTTIEKFDVYKVDTIGDAYMVCSGLPQRNGINHCKNIADLSFALLEKSSSFEIRHMPEERLKIRIGINCGPVTAGVVGTKMPQYCVFGDTVNTASRMESTSLPLHIQVSDTAHDLLEKHFPEYIMSFRGDLEVKGKGTMRTYWLHPPEQHPVYKITQQKKCRDQTHNRRRRKSNQKKEQSSEP